jgi:hypothetical protein
MDARCSSGKIAMLGKVQPVEARPLLVVLAFLLGSAVIVGLTGWVTVMQGAP